MARMLGAARLSHFTDSSTSVERQSEQIEATATARGDTLIHTTEDVDTSGAVSPFDRDELGPWLTNPELMAKWDVLCITKLDRLTRSIAHFVAMVDWCTKHGKTVVSIGDSFDLGTPVGRMVAHILALFAQFERERMAERRLDHTRKALAQARWDGRAIAPGYRPLKVGDHWELELDPAKAQRIKAMASAVIGGQSARQAGAEYGLDSAGVISILRNPAVRGYVIHHGDVVRDENGLPVTREAILDDETWTKLQSALDRNGSDRLASGDASLLRGVVTCWDCGQALYILRREAGSRYRHADGSDCRSTYLARDVEAAIEGVLLFLAEDAPRVEIVTVGEDHTPEIRRVEQSIGEIEESVMSGDMPAASAARMLGKLETRLSSLRSLPEPRRVPQRTGETFGEHWASLDVPGRNRFLRAHGFSVRVSRSPLPSYEVRGTVVRMRTLTADVDPGELPALAEVAEVA